MTELARSPARPGRQGTGTSARDLEISRRAFR